MSRPDEPRVLDTSSPEPEHGEIAPLEDYLARPDGQTSEAMAQLGREGGESVGEDDEALPEVGGG